MAIYFKRYRFGIIGGNSTSKNINTKLYITERINRNADDLSTIKLEEVHHTRLWQTCVDE